MNVENKTLLRVGGCSNRRKFTGDQRTVKNGENERRSTVTSSLKMHLHEIFISVFSIEKHSHCVLIHHPKFIRMDNQILPDIRSNKHSAELIFCFKLVRKLKQFQVDIALFIRFMVIFFLSKLHSFKGGQRLLCILASG